MAKMTDIKKMNDADIAKMVGEKREAVRAFRFGTGREKVGEWRQNRKDIARGLTELNSRANAKTE